MNTEDETNKKQLTIRIDKSLYERISELAKKENRNKNGQVEYMLKKFMEIKE
jgi:Uncharacterized protein conserved in bacteria